MKKWIQHLFVVFALVGLDQLTKLWARTQFAGGDSLVIIPNVFRFIYHENTGAVWGILSDQTFFLSIVTVIALIIMLWFYVKMPKPNIIDHCFGFFYLSHLVQSGILLIVYTSDMLPILYILN